MFRLAVALCALTQVAYAQSVALSFDDGFDPRVQQNAGAWNQAILADLAKAKIKSVFFVAGGRVDSPAGLELVKNWGLAGHMVANHTYSHRNFNDPANTLG